MALTAGQRIGVYEVSGSLGAGGMGEVYRARDTRLGRDVALKILPEIFASDPERLARFEREAQVLASLNHPHIAAIHGLDESGGVRALVMELVDGQTLAERIAGQPLPVEEALAIARQMADALEAAHEQGIIHRDLKPANIKITSAGAVKVLDFGLAKLNDPNASNGSNAPNATMSPTLISPAMTTVGVLLGTAAYMAPEQARGRPIDRRVDVWAFGCVLFEMLSGRHVFPGSDVTEVLATVLKSDPDWNALPPSTPPRIRAVLERCLQKDPKLRIRDIGDARLALDGAFETAAPAATHASVPASRPRWAWPAAAAAAAVMTAAATWYISRPAVEPDVPTRFSLVLPSTDQLTFAAGTMVAVSPDGQTLAYRVARNGTFRLFVRRIDQFEAEVIGDPVPGEAPFFSPDGEWIVYLAGNALRKVSVRGGPPETIAPVTDNYRGGDWTVDGTIVLAGAGLDLMPAAGGAPTRLATAPAGRRFWYPQVIANGRAILYTSSGPRPDAGDIEVFDVANKISRKLLSGAASRLLPTGHLVFIRSGTLWVVRFDEASLQVQGTPVPVVEGIRVEGGGAVQYSVGRDGTLMYIHGANSTASNLVWIDRKGGEVPIDAARRTFYSVRVHPASGAVALDVRDSGDGADIWVLPPGRQTPTRVTFDAADDTQPAWMPDGRLVFTSTRGNSSALFSQASDGTGEAVTIASDDQLLDQVTVTTDGRFAVARRGEDIVMVTIADQKVMSLIDSPFRDRNPDVSRDGRWIAYQSDESGSPEVYVRPFPDVGKGKWQVSEGGGTRPVWAHNRRELFYLGADAVLRSVTFEAAGSAFTPSAPTPLGMMPPTPGAHRAFDVAADDQRFLTMKGEMSYDRAEINVVKNWVEELKKRVPVD
jgi:serine/threonine-protein kinase